MSNSLIDLKKTFKPVDSYKIGIMISATTVQFPNLATAAVWGTAAVGDMVLIKSKQIVAIINKSDTKNIYVS